jgi:ABC-type nitrate/sulfonate/bicarbonate transport system substrate-binding protein
MLVLGAAATGAGAGPQASKQLPTVTLGTARDLPSALLYGMPRFAERFGIKLEIKQGSTFADVERFLTLGDADVAFLGYHNIAVLADKGVTDVKVIAGVHRRGTQFIARQGSGIQRWKDIEGKRIALIQGSYTAVMFMVAASTNGVDLSKVRFTNMTPVIPTVVSALRSGAYDGLVIWPPDRQKIMADSGAYLPRNLNIYRSDLGDPFGLLVASGDFMKKPGQLRSFLRAYVASVNHYKKNPRQWAELAVQISGADRTAAERAILRDRYKPVISFKVKRSALIAAAKRGTKFGFTRSNHASKVAGYLNLGPLARVLKVKPASLIG